MLCTNIISRNICGTAQQIVRPFHLRHHTHDPILKHEEQVLHVGDEQKHSSEHYHLLVEHDNKLVSRVVI